MNPVTWRSAELRVLAIAVVLSVGAGLIGSYFGHASKTLLLEGLEKSYERLWREAPLDDNTASRSGPSVASTEMPRVVVDEIPMDSLWESARDAVPPAENNNNGARHAVSPPVNK